MPLINAAAADQEGKWDGNTNHIIAIIIIVILRQHHDCFFSYHRRIAVVLAFCSVLCYGRAATANNHLSLSSVTRSAPHQPGCGHGTAEMVRKAPPGVPGTCARSLAWPRCYTIKLNVVCLNETR